MFNIYSHLVCSSKFVKVQVAHKQKGGITVYNLPSGSCEKIKWVLTGQECVLDSDSKV
jgi:hypothetical protein